MVRKKLLKKPLLLIYGIAGIGMLGHILVQPVLPIFARRLGASGLEVGLLTSGFMLARAITAYFVGRHIDMSGRRASIMRIGLLMLFALTILYFWAGELFMLILLRFGQGICSGLIWPVAQTMVAENAEAGYRTRALSLYQITGRIGALLSRVFLSAGLLFAASMGLGEIGSFRFVFLLAAIIVLVGFIESLLLPRQKRKRTPASSRQKPYTLFILGFAFGALLALTPISMVYLNEQYNISPLGLAVMLLVLDVVTMFVMYLSSHLTDIIGFRRSLMIISVPCFIAALLLPIASTFMVFVVLYFVMRSAISSFLPISRSQATSTSVGIGSNIGTLNMTTNLGAVVGPLVGGFLYDTMSGSFRIGGYTVIALLLIPLLINQVRKAS
jgi:DHA1 family multidrug resistance protein-like MFS transporter